MVNWKKLSKLIPPVVQIGPKVMFQVLWTKEFSDDSLGQMHHDIKQIQIRQDQSDKEKVLTYLHELLHAFSDHNDIGLTEKQVTLLEKKMIYYVLKPGNIFKE